MARKKRRANYSEEELSVLLQEIQRRKNVLLGKYFVTIQAKNDEWEHVAAAVNAVSNVRRDRDDIRKKFYDYRTHVKRKVRSRNSEDQMEPLSVTEEAMLDILSNLPTEMARSDAMIEEYSEEDNVHTYRNCNVRGQNVMAVDLRNFRIDKEIMSRNKILQLRSFRNEMKRGEVSELNNLDGRVHTTQIRNETVRRRLVIFPSLRTRKLSDREVHCEAIQHSNCSLPKPLHSQPIRINENNGKAETGKRNSNNDQMKPLSVTGEAMLDILNNLPTEIDGSDAVTEEDSEKDNVHAYRNCDVRGQNVLTVNLRNVRIAKETMSRSKTLDLRSFQNERKRKGFEVNHLDGKVHKTQNRQDTVRRKIVVTDCKTTNTSSLFPSPSLETRELREGKVHRETIQRSQRSLSKLLHIQPAGVNENNGELQTLKRNRNNNAQHQISLKSQIKRCGRAQNNLSKRVPVRSSTKECNVGKVCAPSPSIMKPKKFKKLEIQRSHVLSKPLYIQPLRPDEKFGDLEADKRKCINDNPLGGVSMRVLISRLSTKTVLSSESNQPLRHVKHKMRTRRRSSQTC